MKFRFYKKYFFCFILIFLIEVVIALFIKDDFIRPYFGDFLVVILVCFFARSCIEMPKYFLAFFSFLFCCFIEVLQFFKIVESLGLSNNIIMKVVLGTNFSWEDIAMYFFGFLVLVLCERFFNWN